MRSLLFLLPVFLFSGHTAYSGVLIEGEVSTQGTRMSSPSKKREKRFLEKNFLRRESYPKGKNQWESLFLVNNDGVFTCARATKSCTNFGAKSGAGLASIMGSQGSVVIRDHKSQIKGSLQIAKKKCRVANSVVTSEVEVLGRQERVRVKSQTCSIPDAEYSAHCLSEVKEMAQSRLLSGSVAKDMSQLCKLGIPIYQKIISQSQVAGKSQSIFKASLVEKRKFPASAFTVPNGFSIKKMPDLADLEKLTEGLGSPAARPARSNSQASDSRPVRRDVANSNSRASREERNLPEEMVDEIEEDARAEVKERVRSRTRKSVKKGLTKILGF